MYTKHQELKLIELSLPTEERQKIMAFLDSVFELGFKEGYETAKFELMMFDKEKEK